MFCKKGLVDTVTDVEREKENDEGDYCNCPEYINRVLLLSHIWYLGYTIINARNFLFKVELNYWCEEALINPLSST